MAANVRPERADRAISGHLSGSSLRRFAWVRQPVNL